MTWWDVLTPLAAFAGAFVAVMLYRRPPQVLRDLGAGEVTVRPNGVHVTPHGTVLEHHLGEGCVCRPRMEQLRTVPILVHRDIPL